MTIAFSILINFMNSILLEKQRLSCQKDTNSDFKIRIIDDSVFNVSLKLTPFKYYKFDDNQDRTMKYLISHFDTKVLSFVEDDTFIVFYDMDPIILYSELRKEATVLFFKFLRTDYRGLSIIFFSLKEKTKLYNRNENIQGNLILLYKNKLLNRKKYKEFMNLLYENAECI